MDVLTVGLAVMDIFISPVTRDVFDNETVLAEKIGISTGGDAANEACVLASLGRSAALIARVGKDDMGDMFIDRMAKKGVDVSLVKRAETSITTTCVALVQPDGQRSIINLKGNNFDFNSHDIDFATLPSAKALSVGSLYGMPALEADGGLLRLLRHAKSEGMITFADMARDKFDQKLEGLPALLPQLDYFVPSVAEAAGITGLKDVPEMARVFLDLGAKNVIIKCGEHGVYFSNGSVREQVPAYRADTRDTTGAGDTFCAGLIHAVLKGKDALHACDFACATAALSTEYFGASLTPVSEENVAAFIARSERM